MKQNKIINNNIKILKQKLIIESASLGISKPKL